MKMINIPACLTDIFQKENELKEAKENLNNEFIELAKSILYPFAKEIKGIKISEWKVSDGWVGKENIRYELEIRVDWLNAPTIKECDDYLQSITKPYNKENVPILYNFDVYPKWVSLSTPSNGVFDLKIFPSKIDRFLYIQTTSETQLNQEID